MKKTKQHILVLVLFGFLFGINSCKDECSKVIARYDIAPELKDFYFKKGTYWVYEDTANHVVDSQYVYLDSFSNDYDYAKANNGSYCSVSHQFFKTYIQITIAGKIDSFEYGTYANMVSNSHFVVSRVSPPYTGNDILWLNKPIGPIQANIRYNGNIYQSINGVGYSDVFWYSAIIGTGIGSDYLKYNTDYYFVPKIGVVKKVEFGTPTGTRTWVLKRYVIQQ